MKYRNRAHRIMRTQLAALRRVDQMTQRVDGMQLDHWLMIYGPRVYKEGQRANRMRDMLRRENRRREVEGANRAKRILVES